MSARVRERLFRFKQFAVTHARSGMKVGTDGVLLGAWTDISNCKSVLDIGAGSGLIALMIAQRTAPNVPVHAVELDASAYEDAHENFKQSPWTNRLFLHHSAVQEFKPPHLFDLIISNPPYFKNSYKPEQQTRMAARHTDTLSFADLLNASFRMLSDTGKLSIILPPTESQEFLQLANSKGMQVIRECQLRSRKDKPVERILREYRKNQKTKIMIEQLCLHESGDDWSADYQMLTRDFYLKL
jgi:tRNA1Val (adenine37-N6)-methyltransferase